MNAHLIKLGDDRAAFVGTAEQVGRMVSEVARDGWCLTVLSAAGKQNEIRLDCQVESPETARAQRRRKTPTWVLIAGGCTAVAATAGIGWLVGQGLEWLWAHPLVLIGVALMLNLLKNKIHLV